MKINMTRKLLEGLIFAWDVLNAKIEDFEEKNTYCYEVNREMIENIFFGMGFSLYEIDNQNGNLNYIIVLDKFGNIDYQKTIDAITTEIIKKEKINDDIKNNTKDLMKKT